MTVSSAPFPNTAEVYDSALRFTVPSRTRPAETHVVDLGAYNGQGRCDCKDYATRFEPLLARGIKPEEAWERKLIPALRDYQLTPADSLSCWHLVDARATAARRFICAMINASKAQAGGGAEEGRK